VGGNFEPWSSCFVEMVALFESRRHEIEHQQLWDKTVEDL
jgi:hypothetical protein